MCAMTAIPTKAARSPRSSRAILLRAAGDFALAVLFERRRIAKGSRKGTRRVDVETGEDPTMRQTIVFLGAQRSVRWLAARAIPTPGSLVSDEMSEELRRAAERHGDDPAARQRAIAEVFERQGAGAYSSWLPVALRTAVVALVNRRPVPFLGERQTLADLVAGTKMVGDATPRWRRLLRGRAESS